MAEKICGIYKITSPSDKIYIGQSKNIHQRMCAYRKGHCKRQVALHASFQKYGVNSHTFEVIEECEERELDEKEKYYIKKYDSFNTSHGLNLTSGGSRPVFSKQSIQKFQKRRTGLRYDLANGRKRTSKYFGVHKDSKKNAFVASTTINGKSKYICTSKNELLVASRYDEYVLKHMPFDVTLNRDKFPEVREYAEKNKGLVSRDRRLNLGAKSKNSTSKYYGVRSKKGSRSFSASIMVNREVFHVGSSINEIEVANMYDEFVTQNLDFYIPLNRDKFPEVNDYYNKKPVQLSIFKDV